MKIALVSYLAVTMILAAFVPMEASAAGIVVIKSHDIDPYNQALAGFSEACSNHITQYSLGGRKAKQKRIVKEIIATKPRFILAIGLLAAKMAKDKLKDFPVLYVMVSNPKKYGLVGNNIAGISLDIPVETQFKIYKSILPRLKTIGTIYDPDKTEALIREARVVAIKLGLEIFAVPISSQKEVPAALRRMLGKVDTLWMVPDETVVTAESFKYVLVTTFENSLPFLAASDIFVEVGALASVTPDYTDVGRQSCELAVAFTKGQLNLTKVNVVLPSKVILSLNLKTASKIGLEIPKEVIESAGAIY